MKSRKRYKLYPRIRKNTNLDNLSCLSAPKIGTMVGAVPRQGGSGDTIFKAQEFRKIAMEPRSGIRR
jgi:hypothetical protein